MKKLLRYILPTLLCVLASYISAQSAGIGNFYDHLPYHNGSSLCISKEKIYVASGQAIFTYDLSDNSIETYSKVNKLSDLGVTSIAYSEKHNSVIIGYGTGNIDLIVNNQVNRATRREAPGVGHIQGLHNYALSRKSRVSMDQNGNDFVFFVITTTILSGANRTLNNRINNFKVRGIKR